MVKKKLKRFALTFMPKKDRFVFRELKKGQTIKNIPKAQRRDTSIVRGTSGKDAFKRLSGRSFKAETGRKL